MYLKVKNVFYKLSEDLNLQLNNLFATIDPTDGHKFAVFNDYQTYKINVHQALITIDEKQVKNIITDIISRLFDNFATDIEVHFEPRDLLKINFRIQNLVPIGIEGTLKKDKEKNTLVYNFDNIWFYKLSFKTLLEPISKIPGLSISYKTRDNKAKLEMHCLQIFIEKFIDKLNVDLTIDDVSFTESALVLDISNENVLKLEETPLADLPESHAYFKNLDIKLNNLEVANANVYIFKENGEPFLFSFGEYRTLVNNSLITLMEDDTLVLKVKE